MKKWLAGFLIVLLLLTGSVYVFIPNAVTFKSDITARVTQLGLHRMLLDTDNVKKWWPEKNPEGGFFFNGHEYKFHNNNLSHIPITIDDKETMLSTGLYIGSLDTDSLRLEWVASRATSYNPIQRFLAWQKANRLKKDMDVILKQLVSFYSNPENIYGIKVREELVKDSALISTSASSNGYPDTKFIYMLIDKLRKHAAANDAIENGFPMLNVDTNDSITFNVRVALPINKLLPDAGDIFQKRMPANGNILVADVTGGNGVATRAFRQIIQYAVDYKRVPPAIPFFSLITDRSKEADSSKWITKVYCPVM